MKTNNRKSQLIPVILSGGSGTRLWPVSRADVPKQFCRLFSESLFESTVRRLLPFSDEMVVVTNKVLKSLTEKKLLQMDKRARCLYEPKALNTAIAVYLACHDLQARGFGQEIVGVFPADHVIQNEESFARSLQLATQAADRDLVVVFGISPNGPSTEYGYIEVSPGSEAFAQVKRFHEKPNEQLALEFFKSGHFLWNAGIFVFRVQTMLNHFAKAAPEIAAVFAKHGKDSLDDLSDLYQDLPSMSLDKGIIEKLNPESLTCLPIEMGWSDVGSWDALSEFPEAAIETGNLISEESKNNFISGPSDKIYAMAGVEDLIIVDTSDALAVIRKGRSHVIKKVAERLKKEHPRVINFQRVEERPWGVFEVLKDQPHFKAKVLFIRPNEQISYQSHKHRSEHWIITRGKGLFTLNDESREVLPGQYLFIPVGAKHRIKSMGPDPLELVEVQLGSSFAEEDIIRYQDDYQRNTN